MSVIKANSAAGHPKRPVSGSETGANRSLRRTAENAPAQSPSKDAVRTAISSRTAARSDLIANAPPQPHRAPIESADAGKAAVELLRAQITQQPDKAMAAQANALPDRVLGVLSSPQRSSASGRSHPPRDAGQSKL